MTRQPVFNLAVAAGYVLIMAIVAWGLFSVRGWTKATYGNVQAQADWQQFREDVADSAGGPVKRSVPKSNEPPALVLLRDYFRECLIISLVMTSALYVAFAFFVRGVLTPDETPDDDTTDSRSVS